MIKVIDFEITSRCDAACSYCTTNKNNYVPTNFDIEKGLVDLKDVENTTFVVLGGEILNNIDGLITFSNKYKELGLHKKNNNIFFYTNGQEFSLVLANIIQSIPYSMLVVSCDAVGPTSFERGVGNQIVLNNISEYLKHTDQICVAMTLSVNTYDQVFVSGMALNDLGVNNIKIKLERRFSKQILEEDLDSVLDTIKQQSLKLAEEGLNVFHNFNWANMFCKYVSAEQSDVVLYTVSYSKFSKNNKDSVLRKSSMHTLSDESSINTMYNSKVFKDGKITFHRCDVL